VDPKRKKKKEQHKGEKKGEVGHRSKKGTKTQGGPNRPSHRPGRGQGRKNFSSTALERTGDQKTSQIQRGEGGTPLEKAAANKKDKKKNLSSSK